jgi:Domain of unknown function (DUF4399)
MKVMKNLIFITIFLALFPLQINAHGDEENKHQLKAKAFIISPKDGDKVAKTFTVKFGLMGMQVSPAGKEVHNSGHHHLLIDTEVLPDLNKPLGAEVTHFGGGQTETTLTLSPGKHTLQLILGDHLHRPHNPPVLSRKITITVE